MKMNNDSNVSRRRYIRPLAWFLAVTCLHFLLSVAGTVVSIRASFDTQAGFRAAPGETTLAFLSGILLSPLGLVRLILPIEWRGGYAEIATLSLLFGALTVGIFYLSRGLRPRRTPDGMSGPG